MEIFQPGKKKAPNALFLCPLLEDVWYAEKVRRYEWKLRLTFWESLRANVTPIMWQAQFQTHVASEATPVYATIVHICVCVCIQHTGISLLTKKQ